MNCFYAVHARHRNIHDDHVRPQLPRQANRYEALFGLTNQLEIGFPLQERSQPIPYEAVIVRQHNPDSH
jgi:hypothetical protein